MLGGEWSGVACDIIAKGGCGPEFECQKVLVSDGSHQFNGVRWNEAALRWDESCATCACGEDAPSRKGWRKWYVMIRGWEPLNSSHRLTRSVIRLKGRRTPHQDLKGPLIEITQPSISNQWATGGPPLVLISHPSGMTPDEERFYTENRSTWLSQNWAWMGAPICPHLWRKRNKGMAHYTLLYIALVAISGVKRLL